MSEQQLEKHKVAIQTPFEISVIVTTKNDRPCIELRRSVQDPEIIKTLVSCAFHNVPVIVVPRFTNTMQSLNTLVNKGVIYREGENYFYTL